MLGILGIFLLSWSWTEISDKNYQDCLLKERNTLRVLWSLTLWRYLNCECLDCDLRFEWSCLRAGGWNKWSPELPQPSPAGLCQLARVTFSLEWARSVLVLCTSLCSLSFSCLSRLCSCSGSSSSQWIGPRWSCSPEGATATSRTRFLRQTELQG